MQRQQNSDRKDPADLERFVPNASLLEALAAVERAAKLQPEDERRQLEAFFRLK